MLWGGHTLRFRLSVMMQNCFEFSPSPPRSSPPERSQNRSSSMSRSMSRSSSRSVGVGGGRTRTRSTSSTTDHLPLRLFHHRGWSAVARGEERREERGDGKKRRKGSGMAARALKGQWKAGYRSPAWPGCLRAQGCREGSKGSKSLNNSSSTSGESSNKKLARRTAAANASCVEASRRS